jgi:hypothetical protein
MFNKEYIFLTSTFQAINEIVYSWRKESSMVIGNFCSSWLELPIQIYKNKSEKMG